MTEKSRKQELLNRYSIASDNDRKVVEAKLLDEIAKKGLANAYRTVQRLVSESADGTTMDNLERKIAIPLQRSHSITIAAGIIQMLNLQGFKKIPWNEKRRNLVKFLFSETLLPEYSFSVINHQNRSTLPLDQLETSSRTAISTESETSQPLALPTPSEPSRISATAS